MVLPSTCVGLILCVSAAKASAEKENIIANASARAIIFFIAELSFLCKRFFFIQIEIITNCERIVKPRTSRTAGQKPIIYID